MKSELKSYVDGKSNYTHSMSILMGPDRKGDPYVDIGKYIVNIFNGKLPGSLERFEKRLIDNKKIIKKINIFKDGLSDTYSSIAIFFITATLNEDSLRKIFGEPIYHSEFGEGFEGVYNKVKDEYLPPVNKELYASYFVDVANIKLHIGYDHRGTSIEPLYGTKVDELIKAINGLVDLYKEKIK